MDRLRCLQVFAEVARSGSFVRAAQKLGISRATATKHVAWLEQNIGARLLHRTTKQVSLTEAGMRTLDGAGELLDRFERMESEVRDSVRLPRGAIRIGTPQSFGIHYLTGIISQFSQRYPDIEVTMVLDDGGADLVAEALDLSIRIGPALRDSSYVAQVLLKAPQLLVAAPSYLQKQGTPRAIKELAQHNCLIHTVKSPMSTWRFLGKSAAEVRVRGTLRSNLGDVLKQAAVLGLGISMHPTYMVAADIESGALRVLLPDYQPEELDISVVFSTRRNLPVRVRHLLEFIKAWARMPQEWPLIRVTNR